MKELQKARKARERFGKAFNNIPPSDPSMDTYCEEMQHLLDEEERQVRRYERD